MVTVRDKGLLFTHGFKKPPPLQSWECLVSIILLGVLYKYISYKYAYVLLTSQNMKRFANVYEEEQRAIKRRSNWWLNRRDVLGDTIWASSPSLVTTFCLSSRIRWWSDLIFSSASLFSSRFETKIQGRMKLWYQATTPKELPNIEAAWWADCLLASWCAFTKL